MDLVYLRCQDHTTPIQRYLTYNQEEIGKTQSFIHSGALPAYDERIIEYLYGPIEFQIMPSSSSS